MAESKSDRVRAAKLRARKKLTPANAKWLRDYEARVAIAKARLLARTSATVPATRERPAPGRPSSASTSGDRTPHLELGAGAPEPVDKPPAPDLTEPQTVVVQETVPVEGNIAPEASTWIPTVPPASEDAEAPPPGAPPPPVAGAPLVDEATPGAPQGDPAAAAQFAALVVFITHAGYSAALELSEGWPVPAPMRALANSETAQAKLLEEVGAAASRVAVRYNFKSIPLADEAVVVGCVGGSVAAVIAVQKRRSKKKKPATSPDSSSETPTEAPPAADMPAHIAAAFAGQS